MSNWLNTTLGEMIATGKGKIQTGPFGSQLHATDYVDVGIPCIMPANMSNNRVNLNGVAKITKKDANRLSQHLVRHGDIVYSRRGDVTQKALIRENEVGYFCGTGCLLIRPGEKLDSEFLTYYLSTPKTRNWIISQAVGATMPNLNTSILSNIPLRIPTKPVQQKIALTLSVIDNKIELNNRINAELEAIAKTLYDYWFVQFDFPDANGKPYKTSGGKMVYNPTLKREIPVGWADMLIESCADLFRGVTYGKDDVLTNNNSAIGVLRATNITGNQVDIDELVYVPHDLVSENQILKKFETLIVMSSGSTEHIGKNGIYYFEDKCAFGAFCSKLEIHKEYTFYLNTFLNTVWFKTYIKNQCLGTNINNLTNEHIKKCTLVKPDSTTLENFDKHTKPLYEKIAVNCQENVQLKKLRDWLLPMLMNGQVSVKD